VWNKYVANWEVEVVWGRGKVVVVMTIEAKPKPVPSFTEALNAFETIRVFMYAHFTELEQANIISVEGLLFSVKRKGAAEQMKICDFLKKK
jgi:hypothetical protein